MFRFVTKDVFLAGENRTYHIVDHPGGAGVLALHHGRIVLVEQYRPAIDRSILEIPAGMIEPGEESLSCAQRELREETGFTARHWQSLGAMYPTPGYSSEITYLFYATDLVPGRQDLDDGEEVTLNWVSSDELIEMIVSGVIQDGKTILAFLRYLQGA